MIGLDVRSNVKQWTRRMTAIQRKQVPFATVLALTKTAVDIKRNTDKTLSCRLDRPTPFTKRGLFVRKATKIRLVVVAGFKGIQAAYLDKPERGGTRKPKWRAILMPAGARLNKYGNLARGGVAKMLARPDTFSGEIKGVAGIWQGRKGGGIKLMVACEPRATYRPQLRFRDSARKTAISRFPINWRRTMKRALATAR